MTPRYGEPMRGGRPVRAAQLGVPDPRVDGPPPGAVDNEPAAERSGLAAVETGLHDLDVLDLLLDAPTVPPPASGDPREMPAATPPAEPVVASPAGETENEAREPENEATVAHRPLSLAQLAEHSAGAIPVTGQVHRSGSIPPTGVVDAPPATPAPAGHQLRPRPDLAQSPAVWFWIWGPLLV